MVYEDVMDAKQACDKLNGFNFQNRYLVGMSRSSLEFVELCYLLFVRFRSLQRRLPSSLPSARKDGEIERRSCGATGESREAQTPAWNRMTVGSGVEGRGQGILGEVHSARRRMFLEAYTGRSMSVSA